MHEYFRSLKWQISGFAFKFSLRGGACGTMYGNLGNFHKESGVWRLSVYFHITDLSLIPAAEPFLTGTVGDCSSCLLYVYF